jgi:hypothetical protein
MSSADNRLVLHDRELVELLSDEPELLAILDAYAATQRQRRPVPRPAAVATVASLVVAAAILLLISPWRGNPSLAERALGAVGDRPVLHLVITQPALFGGPLVDLKSGQTISRTLQTEVWFDRNRHLKKTTLTLDGEVLDEQLETDAGGWTTTGRIYTCAWIAAHPVEATRAGVSCNASGDNGTTPHTIPEPSPTLDPTLAGFLDDYQSALASGEARQTGTGTIDGHDVIWLQFEADGVVEQVAVDAGSYKPVLVERPDAGVTLRVKTAETLSYDAVFFTKPQQIAPQLGGTVSAETNVSPEQGAAILGGHAMWLGRSWNSLTLVATANQERTVGFGAAREPDHVNVIKFTYAPIDADGTVDQHSRIDVYETTSCVLSVGWTCTPRDPSAAGTVELLGPISLLRSNGLYVSIWNWVTTDESLEIARALTPISGTR